MEPLEIVINRQSYDSLYTGGTLQVNNLTLETVEDAVRKIKIMHKTAIPAGRYKVIPYVFGSLYQIRPLLLEVPDFSGIFIHPGNTHEDTSGCLLVGKSRTNGFLYNSKIAYAELCFYLCEAWADKRDVYVTINDKEAHPWYDQAVA